LTAKNITVVGQGYVGLPIAVKAAEFGHKVIGFDIDNLKISKLKLGITSSTEVTVNQLLDLQSSGNLSFTTELDDKIRNDIYVIAVPTPLNLEHEPDLSMLENACTMISRFIKPNTLVINESTSFIGTLRNFVKPLIESKSGLADLEFAVAPERIDPSSEKWDISNTPRIIAGLTKNASDRALEFYRNICSDVHQVSKPEVAEAAKLIENTFRLVNISLINELSQIASKLDFSIHESIKAASTKPFGFMPFFPSVGIGGHCIPVDPSYLKYSAELAGVKSDFIDLANKINLSMPKNIANRIKSEIGGDLINKKIQVVGIAYKPNISDLRESPSIILIDELIKYGAIVKWFDPLVGEYKDQKSSPLDPDVDLGLIVTPHETIDYSIWLENNTKVFDLSPNLNNYGWPKFF
jgi:UDP-N-acetyl-D-glucosamine dehydrogenase